MAEKPLPTWMRPLWVRLAFVVVPALWAVFEFVHNQEPMWGILFAAAAAWGLWTLVVKYDPGQPPKA